MNDVSGSLAGKVAVVTGAARGIGRGIAIELARAGARVAVADLDAAAAVDTAASIAADGYEALGTALDVTDQERVGACVRASVERFGCVDILVNNAGIHCESLDRPSTVEEFRDCFDVNLFGVWQVTQAFLPHLRARRAGKIVNIASVNGRTPWPHTPAYSASKAALINLTRSLAVTLASDNISVNAVCPRSVLTGMVDHFWDDHDGFVERAIGARLLKRALTPEDIGRAVAFFASPWADMITGQSLNVDGGVVMS